MGCGLAEVVAKGTVPLLRHQIGPKTKVAPSCHPFGVLSVLLHIILGLDTPGYVMQPL